MNIDKKYCLVAKIKGLAMQSQHTKMLIKKSKKIERVWALCDTKRFLGLDARHHLLAYGALNGTPYRLIEATCRFDNKPKAELIFKILETHGAIYILAKIWSIEKVEAWLANDTIKPIHQPVRSKRSVEFLATLRKKLEF